MNNMLFILRAFDDIKDAGDIYYSMNKNKKNVIGGKFIPLVLPSNNNILNRYIKNNKVSLMETVISSIDYAVARNLPIAEAFTFEDTDFVITINNESFKENVEQIYQYYIDNEYYELCNRVLKLKQKLNEKQKCG